MPGKTHSRPEIMDSIMSLFENTKILSLEDVITNPTASEYDVKSCILGLLMRGELKITDDYSLRRGDTHAL